MTTMNMNPKNLLMLAALGVGAYFLTTRRAVAGTNSTTAPAPLVWSQSPTRAITSNGQPAGQQGLMAAGFNLVNSLLSGGNAPLYRSPDFNPSYTPDSAGEAAAQSYYANNRDLFATNPPAITADMYERAQREGLSDS